MFYMSKNTNLDDYEREVKRRMTEVLKAAKITQTEAASRMGYSKAAFSRHLNPEGDTQLSLKFCAKFANEFCKGEFKALICAEQGNDNVVCNAHDWNRVFWGLSADIQQGIYDRAVSEADAFREALRKK